MNRATALNVTRARLYLEQSALDVLKDAETVIADDELSVYMDAVRKSLLLAYQRINQISLNEDKHANKES